MTSFKKRFVLEWETNYVKATLLCMIKLRKCVHMDYIGFCNSSVNNYSCCSASFKYNGTCYLLSNLGLSHYLLRCSNISYHYLHHLLKTYNRRNCTDMSVFTWLVARIVMAVAAVILFEQHLV